MILSRVLVILPISVSWINKLNGVGTAPLKSQSFQAKKTGFLPAGPFFLVL